MFIYIDGGYYNTAHIKAYRNFWKASNHEKSGSEVNFTDGTTTHFKQHIEIDDTPLIIPQEMGYDVIEVNVLEDGTTDHWLEPIIAWKVDEHGITPITTGQSWHYYEQANINCGWTQGGAKPVYTSNCTYQNIDAFLSNFKKKKVG